MKKPKPYNGGQWTEARKHSFIMSALRRAKWPQRYAAVKRTFVRNGLNPATGRKCKLHRCEKCTQLFPQSSMQADHIIPVVPLEGFDSWDGVIARMFVEAEHYDVMCKSCHKKITDEENKIRRENKKNSRG